MPKAKLNSALRMSLLATLVALGVHAQAQTATVTDSSTAPPSQSDAGDFDQSSPTSSIKPPQASADQSANSPALTPVDSAAEAAAEKSPDAAAETQVEAPVAPVANSKGLDESALSNADRGHDDYKRPLLFAPADNGLQPDNPQIKWDMDAAGQAINLGGLKISSSQLSVHLDQIKRSTAPSDLRANAKGGASLLILSFSWPTLLTPDGTLTIESADHKVTWSQKITEASRANWRKKLVRYKSSYLKLHQGAQWGYSDLPYSAIRAFRQGASFQVCVSKVNSDIERLKACSAPYSFQTVGNGRTQVLPVASNAQKATVLLKDKSIGKVGFVNAPVGKEISLQIDFADGAMVSIASQPRDLDLLDVVESKDHREIILTGRGAEPLGKKKFIDRPSSHFWAPSGVDQDTIWQIALPKDVPTIRTLGAFNLPFTFLFRFSRLPTELDRVFITEGASTGTYSSEPRLYGYSVKADTKIQSSENKAWKEDPHHFDWDFKAPEVGERNKARITLLNSDSTKWIAHHSLYHGYPFEASARLTGVIGSGGQFILLGELAGGAWAESLGFHSELLSHQRWGLATRYFRAITAIQSQSGVTVSDFSTLNVDLKYNLVRGIWNRDQLFGLIGSLQRIQIQGVSASMGGAGVYWARTLPKVFADLFDKFPALDYSKYVDVEFVFYPASKVSGYVPAPSFNLNFHGKVFWTQRVYGEAGFGIRQYGLIDVPHNNNISFATAYGNIGVGLIF